MWRISAARFWATWPGRTRPRVSRYSRATGSRRIRDSSSGWRNGPAATSGRRTSGRARSPIRIRRISTGSTAWCPTCPNSGRRFHASLASRWSGRRLAGCGEVEGADAATADGICGYGKRGANLHGARSGEDLQQRLLRHAADGRVKEARPDSAVGLHYRRHPGSVAARRHRIFETQVRAKMTGDAAKLLRGLQDEAIGGQRLDLALEHRDVIRVQTHLGLPFDRPAVRAVERARRQIGREKRDRAQAHLSCGGDRCGEAAAVLLLHRAAGRDGEIRLESMQHANTCVHSVECRRNSANPVMNSGRAVERHDDFIEALYNRLGVLFEKESGAQHRQLDSERAQPRAQPEEIGMHERLAAGKDDPAHSQGFDIGRLAAADWHPDVARVGGLPDIAHHATAVAAAVRIQDENRDVHSSTGALAARKNSPRPFTLSRWRRGFGLVVSLTLPPTKTHSGLFARSRDSAGPLRLSAIASRSAGPPRTMAPNP